MPRLDGALPKVPEGFSVSIFADDLQSARMIEYAPNGDLFVSQTAGNRIWRVSYTSARK
jgi:glucose/arabinose dehydrogenase